MADFTNTVGTVILSHNSAAHPKTVVGSAQTVDGKVSATIVMKHALVEATPNTNPGAFYIQVSAHASTNEHWATVATYTTSNATAASEAITDTTESVGSTSIGVAATTDFAAGDIIYIQDAGTAADSEWAQVQELVSATSVELVDGIIRAKDSSDFLWSDAEIFVHEQPLAGIARIRVIYQHEGTTGADTHLLVVMNTADAFE